MVRVNCRNGDGGGSWVGEISDRGIQIARIPPKSLLEELHILSLHSQQQLICEFFLALCKQFRGKLVGSLRRCLAHKRKALQNPENDSAFFVTKFHVNQNTILCQSLTLCESAGLIKSQLNIARLAIRTPSHIAAD